MNLPCFSWVPRAPRREHRAFTLVELLVVLGLTTVLLGLLVPVVTSVKGGRELTAAAYGVAGELEAARNYAIANHTYTWVGFYEQNYANATAPVAAPPPYTGVGHVTLGIVYSKDGTRLVDDAAVGEVPLPAAKLGQVGKLVHFYGAHLTKLNAPSTPNSTDPAAANTLQGRPYQSDIQDNADAIEPTLIRSDSAYPRSGDPRRPFVAQGYTFYKTIRFNPRGEANVNSTLPCTRIIEIGLQPTHGAAKDNNAANLLAVQQAGIGGAVNIYRP